MLFVLFWAPKASVKHNSVVVQKTAQTSYRTYLLLCAAWKFHWQHQRQTRVASSHLTFKTCVKVGWTLCVWLVFSHAKAHAHKVRIFSPAPRQPDRHIFEQQRQSPTITYRCATWLYVYCPVFISLLFVKLALSTLHTLIILLQKNNTTNNMHSRGTPMQIIRDEPRPTPMDTSKYETLWFALSLSLLPPLSLPLTYKRIVVM